MSFLCWALFARLTCGIENKKDFVYRVDMIEREKVRSIRDRGKGGANSFVDSIGDFVGDPGAFESYTETKRRRNSAYSGLSDPGIVTVKDR